MTKRQYEYWMAAVLKLSAQKKIRLREMCGSAEAVYNIEERVLRQSTFLNKEEQDAVLLAQQYQNTEREYEELQKQRIHLIALPQEQYPKRLKSIPDPPYALYVKGNLPDEQCRSIAMVGARNCTAYGEMSAHTFAEKLAEYGVQIISGMAKGIDGYSQRGALDAGGRTFAVLGCGVDICYPRSHIGLYTDILERGGGILSEFPPGTQPLPWHFPLRNRIISGLSDAVLVMEARVRSGSLITADMALEQGKDVYALPGPITSALSQGCNQLIQQGAGVLLSPEMLLEEMGIGEYEFSVKSDGKIKEKKKTLERKEIMVYSSLGLYAKNVSTVIEETGLPAQEVMRILTALEIQGYIKEISKNYYIRL